jgi:biopolymer transport protein ExbD
LNFRKKDVAELELNLTPLIDVVFLLLIFFMVTTTFQKQSELQIKLPQASAKIEQTKTPLEVVINEEGNFFINNKQILFKDRITLMQTLARLTNGNTKQPLVIRADARTPHQAVVTVMDVAGKIGLVKISIATTK